jgi:hypothetical protein
VSYQLDPAECDHEDVSNTNPVRSPMATARYVCHDCGEALREDGPGAYAPVADDRPRPESPEQRSAALREMRRARGLGLDAEGPARP